MAKSDSVIYSSPAEGLEVLSCNSDLSFSSHLHDGYVLWFNSASGEKYSVKGNSDILQPGSISIIEPETIHANSPCSSLNRHLRSFYFSEDFVLNLNRKIFGRGNCCVPFRSAVVDNKILWHKFGLLHDLLLNPHDSLEAESMLLSTFSSLYREGRIGGGLSVTSEDRRVSLIVDYLHAHLDRNITLTELAALAGCTEFHLIRIFRSHKGLPPHSFLIQLRLEKARSLLKSGTGITEAALMVGFSDQSHLTRKFKSRFGLTPRQYQKTIPV